VHAIGFRAAVWASFSCGPIFTLCTGLNHDHMLLIPILPKPFPIVVAVPKVDVVGSLGSISFSHFLPLSSPPHSSPLLARCTLQRCTGCQSHPSILFAVPSRSHPPPCHTSRQKSRPLPLPSTILCPDPRRLPHLPNPSAVVGRGPSSTSIPIKSLRELETFRITIFSWETAR